MKIVIILLALLVMVLGGFLIGYKLGGNSNYDIEMDNKIVIDQLPSESGAS